MNRNAEKIMMQIDAMEERLAEIRKQYRSDSQLVSGSALAVAAGAILMIVGTKISPFLIVGGLAIAFFAGLAAVGASMSIGRPDRETEELIKDKEFLLRELHALGYEYRPLAEREKQAKPDQMLQAVSPKITMVQQEEGFFD